MNILRKFSFSLKLAFFVVSAGTNFSGSNVSREGKLIFQYLILWQVRSTLQTVHCLIGPTRQQNQTKSLVEQVFAFLRAIPPVTPLLAFLHVMNWFQKGVNFCRISLCWNQEREIKGMSFCGSREICNIHKKATKFSFLTVTVKINFRIFSVNKTLIQ